MFGYAELKTKEGMEKHTNTYGFHHIDLED